MRTRTLSVRCGLGPGCGNDLDLRSLREIPDPDQRPISHEGLLVHGRIDAKDLALLGEEEEVTLAYPTYPSHHETPADALKGIEPGHVLGDLHPEESESEGAA